MIIIPLTWFNRFKENTNKPDLTTLKEKIEFYNYYTNNNTIDGIYYRDFINKLNGFRNYYHFQGWQYNKDMEHYEKQTL